MGKPTGDPTGPRFRRSGDGLAPRVSVGLAVLLLSGAILLVLLAPAAGTLQTGPTANLTVSPTPTAPGETVTLDATASTAAGNETIVECSFDVDGDGTDDVTTQSCLYETSYATAGDYAVSVRVRTSADRSATDSTTLVVRANRPPTAAMDVEPADPRPDEEITLSGADSTDQDGDVVTYRWTVDGRSLRGERVTYQVSDAGDLPITLEVVDDDGATNATSRTITVRENRPPVAALDVSPSEPETGESITLDAGESMDADGTIAAYRWDFDGDGTVDRETTTATVSFTARDPGEREAGVTVVDDEGATTGTTARYAVVGLPTASTTTSTTATATSIPGVGDGTESSGGFLDVIDPGFVPVLPDWFVLLVLVVGVGAVVAVRRREAVRSRLSEVQERVRTGAFRKRVAKSASGFVVKTVAKKIIRKGADVVEFVTTGLGDMIERLGRAIKHGGQRLAAFLRKLGS